MSNVKSANSGKFGLDPLETRASPLLLHNNMLFSIYLSTGTSKLNFVRGYLPFGLALDKSITVHLTLG